MSSTPAERHSEHARSWDQVWAESWPLIILLSTAAVEVALLVGADPVVRGPLVIWFSLVCPGMAWVRLLHLREPLTEAVVAVALSVAMSGLTAVAFLYLGHWSPGLTMVVLQTITLLGIAFDVSLWQDGSSLISG